MKNFIEVTEINSKRKSLIPIEKIIEIEEHDNKTAFVIIKIEIFKKGYTTVYIPTVETYAEIKQLIEEASR